MSGGWGTPSRQHGDIEVGEVFVQGKTPEMAQQLLAACDTLGVDRAEVRTVTQGFVVPGAVWDQADETRRAAAGLDL
jgi:hypothetical protein